MRYSVDSSSLIEGFREILPYAILPAFWNRDLPALVAEGELRATEYVLWELEKQDDELLTWVRDLDDLFVPMDEEIQLDVRAVLKDQPRLLRAGRSGADPFVISLARTNGATVVCEERRKPTAPRMPDVCDALGIPCIRLIELVHEQGWSYS